MIVDANTQQTNISRINIQLALIHLPYGISKYVSVAISITLVGATKLVNPYIVCQINAITECVAGSFNTSTAYCNVELAAYNKSTFNILATNAAKLNNGAFIFPNNGLVIVKTVPL